MLVKQILKTKSSDEVVTVPPGMSVARVIEVLSARRIGAVVVSQDGKRPVGMLSERDIVRELGRRGPSILAERVEAIMTAKIVTCGCADAAEAIMQTMTEGRFRHLPVMAGNEMVGLISIGDVVKARLSELSMEKDALEGMIKGF